VQLTAQRLAVVAHRTGQGCYVTVAELTGAQRLGRKRTWLDFHGRLEPLQLPVCAALSDDGRFLAFALKSRQVVVHDFVRDARRTYAGHSDSVCMVAFTAGAGALVTADRDNRVLIRPRASEMFADVTLPAVRVR
jgi:hypothetical protein